jgi:transposase-like protein
MTRENREVWAKRVERLADSGLTAKEFAAEIGVNANTLAGWRWRMRSQGAAADPAPAFVEIVGPREGDVPTAPDQVRPTEVHRGGELLELVLRGGHRVRVPAQFDPAALRRLVDALETR